MLEFLKVGHRCLRFPIQSAAALLVLGSMVSNLCAQASDFDTWLDESGQFKIEAKFMGLSDGNVSLQLKDGKTKAIPYAKLSLSSQYKAKKLADPKAFEAPPLPSSYAPPPLPSDPFPADATIEQYLDIIQTQVEDGHAEVGWYATPPRFRKELQALISKGAEVLGNNTFRQVQVVVPNLLTIVRDKRSFIVGHPLVAAKPEVAKALNQGLPAIEPIVELMTKKSTWSSENFKSENVGPWIMLFANDMMKSYKKALPALQAAFGKDAFPPIERGSYKVLEKTSDSAKVELVDGKKKQTVVFKKVEGFWEPETLEKAFQQVAEQRSALELLDKEKIDAVRAQVKISLTMANTLLGSLAKARTQQEFNQILDPFLSPLMRMQPGSNGMAGMSSPGMSSSGMSPGMQVTPGMGNSGGIPNSGGMPSNFKSGKSASEMAAGQ